MSYDFLINCPTLKLDVPSSWTLDMGISWEDSPDFNEDGPNWSKTHSCWFLLSEVFRVVSLPIFPHKMFVDEKACEEKADLQLNSLLLQTSQTPRLRICRCGSYLLFQKLLILLWANCDATSLCYCPAEEVTVSVGRKGTEEEVSPSLNSSDSQPTAREVFEMGDLAGVWNGWP